MGLMITKLTPNQEAKISHYLEKWEHIGYTFREITAEDYPLLQRYLKKMGINADIIITLDSPMACQIAINLLKGVLRTQLDSQLNSQLETQLRSQLDSHLRSQFGSQLGSQLYSQLESQLRTQLDSQLDSQLHSQLRSQLETQLRTQLDSQLRSELNSQLGSQLYSQLESQLRSELNSQLSSQLYSQLESQLRTQLDSQLDSQLHSELNSQLSSQLSSQLGSELEYFSLYGYGKCGNILSGYCAFYDFLISDVQKLDTKEGMDVWYLFKEFSEKFHYIFPFDGICFVSQKPTQLIFDGDLLSHDQLPSAQYRDGYSVYSIRGVNFDEKTFKKISSKKFEIDDLMAIENSDKRAAAMSLMRPELILEKENAEHIHTGIKGTKLYRVPNFMETGVEEYCMTMKCPSTDREFLEWVSPEIGKQGDADLAQASSFVDDEGNTLALEDYLTMQEA